MSKRVAFSLLVFLIATAAFSQTAYKELKWGNTVDQVRSKVEDLTAEDYPVLRALQHAMLYLHADELGGSAPNPLDQESGTLSVFSSEKQGARYWFLDGKLIGVELSFDGQDIVASLRSKYGPATSVLGAFISYRFETIAWTKDPIRLVVWEKPEGYDFETVYYIPERSVGRRRA